MNGGDGIVKASLEPLQTFFLKFKYNMQVLKKRYISGDYTLTRLGDWKQIFCVCNGLARDLPTLG